jgi:hypothetical protein
MNSSLGINSRMLAANVFAEVEYLDLFWECFATAGLIGRAVSRS